MNQYPDPHQPPPYGPPPQYGPPPGAPPHYGSPPQYAPPSRPPYPPGPPPQYQPPQYPPAPYPPAPQYGPPQDVPHGEPIVIPLVGRGAAWVAKFAKRAVTVTPAGFQVASPKAGWQVGWSELANLVITTAYHQGTGIGSRPIYRVRLIMTPGDPGFPHRHPDLLKGQANFGAQGPAQIGVALGPVENVVPALARAFGFYSGGVFTGVVQEGRVIGFGYR